MCDAPLDSATSTDPSRTMPRSSLTQEYRPL